MAKYKVTTKSGTYMVTTEDSISQETTSSKPSAFQKYGGALPVAGSVLGGIAGGGAGTIFGVGVGGAPGAMAGAGLGGAAGEAGRQLLGRVLGENTPSTSTSAAANIAKEGAMGGVGDGVGGLVGRGMGAAFKALPKIGQGMSGTPARNLVKAQQRGFMGTYFPEAAKGLTREQAGTAQGVVEKQVMNKYFQPREIARMELRKSGLADQVVEDSLTKMLEKKWLTPKEAVSTIKSIKTIYSDTPKGQKVAPILNKLNRFAELVASKSDPEYKAARKVSEATILKDQLSKFLRVNKTNPNEYSGFAGSLGAFKPAAYAATIPFSPLAFGVTNSVLGSLKKNIPAIVRKTLGITGSQVGARTAVEALFGSRK